MQRMNDKKTEDLTDSERKKDKLAVTVIFFIFLMLLIFNIPRNRYVVNLKTGKFHLISCQYAKRINPAHKKYFSSPDSVINRKFEPCNFCRPLENNR
jgi:hypothetical protein